jgi:Ca2+-binding RTX toxin-like protein
MRRIALVLGLAMLLAMVAAGVAVAVTKTCGGTLPCEGTNGEDVLYERIGPNKHDRIFGFDGHDVIDANTFNADRDVLLGGNQGDKLLTNDTDGRDRANGGRGRDVCYISEGDATRSCEVVREATFTAGTSDVSRDLSREAFGQ